MTGPDTAPRDALRDAATVVLVRREGAAEPRVLMGQRGKGAAFMPSKYVFPGGAVDPTDGDVPLISPLTPAQSALGPLAPALVHAAIRELWEETGLALAEPQAGAPPNPAPPGWRGFFATGHAPATAALEPVFRAITPPGRPRRFDARFFLADAAALSGDPDDFSGAEDELGHLHWVALSEVRALDLPFITEIVLAEVEARLARPDQARPVPMFHHGPGRSYIDAL